MSGDSPSSPRKARCSCLRTVSTALVISRMIVEAVEYDAPVAVRQAGARRLDVRLPHVHRDTSQRGPLRRRELVVERPQAVDLAVFGDELDGRLLEIESSRRATCPAPTTSWTSVVPGPNQEAATARWPWLAHGQQALAGWRYAPQATSRGWSPGAPPAPRGAREALDATSWSWHIPTKSPTEIPEGLKLTTTDNSDN